ncbi:MAG: TetR/AcrR family transcriptional regulator [Actinomycetales bacterium]|nr:TetR/AcrR family transcriptional regulator [Actinomycetales bacterium]
MTITPTPQTSLGHPVQAPRSNGPVGTGEPPKRSRSATRERLLDAAAVVFAARGVAGASVEEVCERAGFTRGAFYSNFATKDELVVALLDREEGALLDQLTTALGDALTDPDPVGACAQRLFELQPFGAHNYALRAELTLLAVRDPSLAAPYRATRRSFRDRFLPFLSEGLAAARLELTVPADDALDTLEALFEASVRASIVAGDPNAPDNLAARMLPVLLGAMTTPRCD